MSVENIKKYSDVDDCPVRNVLDRIGDKWSMLVLLILNDNEVLRFNEIDKYIDTISQKMLSVTLKGLEADGLVKRTIYPQIPPRVEYQLTERGKSLIPHLHNLVIWAKDNIGDIKQSRVAYSS
ncbi:putative HTH-type transcriptional regulator YybR [Mariniflexile rhizosphaerae]|uniref:winged helix-turn-helix transcriptional regulator n=1 Tax=unclassified Mariniflexile TaxID=2643887 RepID=UPI000CC591E5|nr:helix-turn-helix domain-containing protein [Mariniflexile sp. TRM1-10]AXP79299.1 putative HTH-type transcriptional regulator YybR [Mariniflexile sp. TRM1-10]PLB17903.1 MAG: Transcriptional regulator, HxlR family [Flavobacteriaceae bacterium FS1-H7996/R]